MATKASKGKKVSKDKKASATPAKQTHKQQQGQKPRSLTPWLIGVGLALLIAVPTGLNFYRQSQLPGERFRSLGNAHIGEDATPRYSSSPPTSGPHLPYAAGWGAYTEVQPDPLLVHNLEDAGVILWYKSGTPAENAAEVKKLENAYDARRYRRVVIAPRDDLETRYAITAWGRLETFDEPDSAQIDAFMEAYEGLDHHPAGGEG